MRLRTLAIATAALALFAGAAPAAHAASSEGPTAVTYQEYLDTFQPLLDTMATTPGTIQRSTVGPQTTDRIWWNADGSMLRKQYDASNTPTVTRCTSEITCWTKPVAAKRWTVNPTGYITPPTAPNAAQLAPQPVTNYTIYRMQDPATGYGNFMFVKQGDDLRTGGRTIAAMSTNSAHVWFADQTQTDGTTVTVSGMYGDQPVSVRKPATRLIK